MRVPFAASSFAAASRAEALDRPPLGHLPLPRVIARASARHEQLPRARAAWRDRTRGLEACTSNPRTSEDRRLRFPGRATPTADGLPRRRAPGPGRRPPAFRVRRCRRRADVMIIASSHACPGRSPASAFAPRGSRHEPRARRARARPPPRSFRAPASRLLTGGAPPPPSLAAAFRFDPPSVTAGSAAGLRFGVRRGVDRSPPCVALVRAPPGPHAASGPLPELASACAAVRRLPLLSLRLEPFRADAAMSVVLESVDGALQLPPIATSALSLSTTTARRRSTADGGGVSGTTTRASDAEGAAAESRDHWFACGDSLLGARSGGALSTDDRHLRALTPAMGACASCGRRTSSEALTPPSRAPR